IFPGENFGVLKPQRALFKTRGFKTRGFPLLGKSANLVIFPGGKILGVLKTPKRGPFLKPRGF
ncbi:hypothetical protein ED857_19585, partial [Acinetobacter baumannii]